MKHGSPHPIRARLSPPREPPSPKSLRDSAYDAPLFSNSINFVSTQGVAGLRTRSVSSSTCTGPRPPSRRCSRSSSR